MKAERQRERERGRVSARCMMLSGCRKERAVESFARRPNNASHLFESAVKSEPKEADHPHRNELELIGRWR